MLPGKPPTDPQVRTLRLLWKSSSSWPRFFKISHHLAESGEQLIKTGTPNGPEAACQQPLVETIPGAKRLRLNGQRNTVREAAPMGDFSTRLMAFTKTGQPSSLITTTAHAAGGQSPFRPHCLNMSQAPATFVGNLQLPAGSSSSCKSQVCVNTRILLGWLYGSPGPSYREKHAQGSRDSGSPQEL